MLFATLRNILDVFIEPVFLIMSTGTSRLIIGSPPSYSIEQSSDQELLKSVSHDW